MAATDRASHVSWASCANFLARTLFLSLRETLGDGFFRSVLVKAGLEGWAERSIPDNEARQFPLKKLETLFEVMARTDGINVQRGILQRSGRAWFSSLSRRSSPALNIFTFAVLTLPKKLRVKRCGAILEEYFQSYMEGVSFSVESPAQALEWQFKLSDSELGVSLGNGLADLWLGFWYEMLYNLSGGKPYFLDLTFCAKEGQPVWVLHIPYLPFEG
ncbi:MAG: hypothetical protein RML93_06705 [Anaerolineales bacterium]|nr:hypothetical protein [Anaerolineales bacterium]MDW8446966.1 hypothetical protein [Anaerolineales bacterium]